MADLMAFRLHLMLL
ncbi:hypothetical protein CGLO_14676 [Colletotrichum gloeosporioides Cg-14]|uniref:Uncharacterized protein n=1 Tax=Colletotrichum gloeosporioides (strain Cg-14) TaxID=1237896 RepID=T0LD77_COLGC|nr:hypothetical protein CGLO_14676 [Colletotrichum gloeosporioides Cg-14]